MFRYDTGSRGTVLDVVQRFFGQFHDAHRHQPGHGGDGQDEAEAGELVKRHRDFLLRSRSHEQLANGRRSKTNGTA